ncbi:Lipopolysaccharide export system ATP-binding protein LptB [Anaerococcus prevotii]|uniref:ABC transporter related n=1 Tax=Anaerococcus prevotii (strain ATCC 9321 / DSM 20548 / JCM 6508 / NCTC 11806 / PC1) TaxID=525919 RepID=C7RFL8_ANAPD|nr:ATP-binding cassette domain-containing protein [Anaerococcus prevotii]ACV28279.1 ABC transporter related [Anaerococcus prevotii DSM 20548]SUU93833.1 Lipopolysaccharide export system ATP-binding protein LptB [Anaerococcus prevotii]
MLEIKNVSKSFGRLKALDHVSFNVNKGDLFGIIGQNGAGKSTLFRCIMDFFDSYEGEILYDNKQVSKVPLEKIGFLPEERSLSPKKTVAEEIRYFARLNLMKNLDQKTLEAYFNKFEIKGSLKDKIKDLSKGNQQKVQLLASLIYKPEFVILDEPFSGLDPYNIRLLQDIIKEINESGTTIIFSSHNMENIEDMCKKLVMLKNGQVVLEGSPKEIRNSYPKDKLLIECEGDISDILNDFAITYTKDSNTYRIKLNDPIDGRKIYQRLREKFDYIPVFAQTPPNLNEIFTRKVEENV